MPKGDPQNSSTFTGVGRDGTHFVDGVPQTGCRSSANIAPSAYKDKSTKSDRDRATASEGRMNWGNGRP